MNKETVRAFLDWLENATDDEIAARQKLIHNRLKQKEIYSSTGRADARFALRLIDEELLARFEAEQFSK